MEKVEQYRQLIQELLQAYSEIKSSNEEVEAEAIFDTVPNVGSLVSRQMIFWRNPNSQRRGAGRSVRLWFGLHS